MSARDEILARVRAAVADVTTEPGARGDVPVIETMSSSPAHTLELFAENVADYRAGVIRVNAAGVNDAIMNALRTNNCRSAVAPTGLDPAWVRAMAGSAQVIGETEASSAQLLDTIDAVVTGSAVGIATTGTIVLDHGPDQGRRELSLVPDTHVCIIRADQVVHDVPEAVTRLRPARDRVRPLTWISGPSATSDIELERVEGVHGPRTLVVILVETDGPPTTTSPATADLETTHAVHLF